MPTSIFLPSSLRDPSGPIFCIPGSDQFSDYRKELVSDERYQLDVALYEEQSGIPIDGALFINQLKDMVGLAIILSLIRTLPYFHVFQLVVRGKGIIFWILLRKINPMYAQTQFTLIHKDKAQPFLV
jgi:hypothetical protein